MQKATRKRVFVSANSSEFSHLRRVVTEELLRKSCDPVAMDHFSTSTGKLVDLLSDKIAQCDAVICLVGDSFGAQAPISPGKPLRSYTQLEFDLAQEHGIQPFIFILKGNEGGGGPHDHLQKNFKESFRGGNLLWHSFSNEEELRRHILGIDFSSLPSPRLPAATKNLKPYLFLLGVCALVGIGILVADKMENPSKMEDGAQQIEEDSTRRLIRPISLSNDQHPSPAKDDRNTSTLTPKPSVQPVSLSGEGKKAGDTLSIQLSPKLAKLFSWCPPGNFTMGMGFHEWDTDKEGWENTKPSPQTVRNGFWMACSELTNGEANLVLETEKFEFATSIVTLTKNPDYPLVGVSWADANGFAQLLSRSRRDGMEVSLPSEIQWEYAARAGTQTAFSFGSECDGTQANCDGMFPFSAGNRKVAPGRKLNSETKINSYAPNAWKIFDMHGNAKEWCLDEGKTLRMAGFGDHIIRGGSWASYPKSCRSGSRAAAPSFRGEPGAGIRLVLQSAPPNP